MCIYCVMKSNCHSCHHFSIWLPSKNQTMNLTLMKCKQQLLTLEVQINATFQWISSKLKILLTCCWHINVGLKCYDLKNNTCWVATSIFGEALHAVCGVYQRMTQKKILANFIFNDIFEFSILCGERSALHEQKKMCDWKYTFFCPKVWRVSGFFGHVEDMSKCVSCVAKITNTTDFNFSN